MSHLVSRRSALLGGGAVMLAAAAPRAFVQANDVPIGLQLYTLAGAARKDLDGVLTAVAQIGFTRIETAGLLGRTPAQFRRALDAAGLKCTAAHVQASAEGEDASFSSDPDRLADGLHTLGATYAVLPIPRIPERLSRPQPGETYGVHLRRALAAFTAEDWRANADFLNAKAAALKARGVRTAYHNHNAEFRPLGGANGFEILLQHTDPDLVSFELDAGWAVAAGADPFALLARHKGRFRLMHVKDIKASTTPNFDIAQDPAEVGAGVIAWSRLLPAAHAAGVEHFFIEQEPPYARPPLEAVKASFDYLSSVPNP